MSYKKFKPFIVDFVMCLTITVVVICSLVYLDYIKIDITMNLLTVTLLIVLSLYLIKILNNTIVIGLKGLVDFVFKKTFSIKAIYVNFKPLFHSTFSTKITATKKRITPTYYLIIVETKGKIITIVSSEYMDFSKGKEYNLKLGYYSHILLSVEEVECQ